MQDHRGLASVAYRLDGHRYDGARDRILLCPRFPPDDQRPASPLKHSLIGRYLPTAVAGPDNLTARGGMQVGACLAGVAFLKGLGLVHSISHMVGAEFDTPWFDNAIATCGAAV